MTTDPKEEGRSWDQHWQDNVTPWDGGAAAPALLEFLKNHSVEGKVVLTPGVGRGWDSFALAKAGARVIANDLAPSAERHFVRARNAQGLAAKQVQLVIGDFFELGPELAQKASSEARSFDMIWDYTFLCALPRDLHDQWVTQTAALLRPGGTLAHLCFPIAPNKPRDQGPPFALEPDEVINEASRAFELVERRRPQASHAGREGKEELLIFKKR